MDRRRRAQSALMAFALAGAAILGFALPGHAGGGGGDSGSNQPVDTGPTSAKSGGCQLYANPSSFGVACGSSSIGLTAKQIMGNEPFLQCWYDKLPEWLHEEYDPLAEENIAKGNPGQYVMKTCVNGIDPKTLDEHPPVTFDDEFYWLRAGDPYLQLGPNETRLMAIKGDGKGIPRPVVSTFPVHPRVGQDFAFYIGAADTHRQVTVSLNGNNVVMDATLIDLSIQPGDPADPKGTVECAHTNVYGIDTDNISVLVKDTDTPFTQPGACWTRYTRSSANAPQQEYPVQITATWSIDYHTAGGPTSHLATYNRTGTTLLPITEVQTVVVP